MVRSHPRSLVATIIMEENKDKLIEEKKVTEKMDWKPILIFYAKTTGWIIIPLVLAIVISKKIAPTLYLLFILVGFGITCFGIYKEIKKYKNSLNKKNGDK